MKRSSNVPRHTEWSPGRCVWCLRPAWSDTETCRACRGIAAYQRLPVTRAHALTGGQWVRRGLVLVWEGRRPGDEPTDQPRRQRVAQCGTESGYRRHQRRHEAACDDCKAAKSAAGRRRYQRNKEKVA